MDADNEPLSEPLSQQIRNLLYTEYLQYRRLPDEEEDSKNSSRGKHQVARHPRSTRSTDTTRSEERTKDSVDKILRCLRRLHNGFPSFDDACPDAGCGFEVFEYQDIVNPVYYGSHNKAISAGMASQSDPDNPRIGILTEEAREAHWKLTAPKGFATLKAIPELQQLLAYTAADVAQYAVGSDELGKPGSWQPPVRYTGEGEAYIRRMTASQALTDGNSLIGQLCPALRLCLAAEVATGLMCDSHTPPPDTPEHASALLLFLAAAIRQASLECQTTDLWPGQRSWRLNPSIENCQTLIDFLACPSVDALQQSIQLCGRAMDSTSSSSSSSHTGSSPPGASTADGIWQQLQQSAGTGNVFCAALQLSGAFHAAWEAAAAQSTAEQSAPASQQQAMVAELLQRTVGLLQAFPEALPQEANATAAAQSTGSAGVGVKAAAAAAEPGSCSSDDPRNGGSSSSSSSSNQSPGNGSTPPTAAQVAWCVAVVAGAAALNVLLSVYDAYSQEEQQAEQLKQGMTVSLALLATEMQALHDSVTDALAEAASREQQQQQQQQEGSDGMQRHRQQGLSAKQQRQQQQQLTSSVPAVNGANASNTYARIKQDTVLQMLQLSSTATNLAQVLLDRSAGGGSSSSSTTTVSSMVSTQQGVHAADVAASAALAAAAAVFDPPDERVRASALDDKRRLQLMNNLVDTGMSPDTWCTQVFATHRQQQLSPLCLHPVLAGQASSQGQQQQQATHAAVAAARAAWSGVQRDAATAAVDAAVEACSWGPDGLCPSRLRLQQWSEHVSTTFQLWLSQQLQPQQQHSNCAAPSSSSSDGGGGGGGGSSPNGLCDEQLPLQQVIGTPRYLKQLFNVAEPMMRFQQYWAKAAGELYVSSALAEMAWHNRRGLLHQKSLKQRKLAELEAKQAQQQAGSGKSKQKGASKAKGTGDTKGAQDGTAAAAAGASQAERGSIDSDGLDVCEDDVKETVGPCPLCELEGPLGAAGAYRPCSSTSSNSSSSSQAGPGLYSRFPVSWSDPYMMRRLLWDLLGKLKPTAQAWFKKHANMCPHRCWAVAWHMVGMCIARHIWAPPGQWDAAAAEQQALLLPSEVRLYDKFVITSSEEDLARCNYANSLNAAFMQQGADGQAAALLCLQVLLALDPHGARLQPQHELLYYTPSGFHAAVCKTLMQALQPQQRPQASQPPGSSSTAASSRLPVRLWQQQSTQQQQQQQQQQQEQQQGQQQQGVCQVHPLQSWSQAAFPAWYVWWHLGLLAYGQHKQQQQQQQQQQAHQPRRRSSGGNGGSKSSSSSSAAVTPFEQLYHDVEARLYAVGYAARQLRTSDQLQRLLSNPPVAAGLSIAPADWVATGPSRLQCGYCDKASSKEQAGAGWVCCSKCWTWYCHHACYSQRCPSHCHVDPLIQVKASRAWRVLDLLRPSLVPLGPQQQQQQQRRVPASGGAAAAAMALHGLSQATHNALPDLYKALLQAQRPAQQQGRAQRRQQWRPRQQQPLAESPLVPLYEPPLWGMTGGVLEGSSLGREMLEATAAMAYSLRVEERFQTLHIGDGDEALRDLTHLWSTGADNIHAVLRKLKTFNREQRTPRQQRHDEQRQRQERTVWDHVLSEHDQWERLLRPPRPPGLKGLGQGLGGRYAPWPHGGRAAAAGSDAALLSSSSSSGVSSINDMLSDELAALDVLAADNWPWDAELSPLAASAAAAASDENDSLAAPFSSLQPVQAVLREDKEEEEEDLSDILGAPRTEQRLVGSVTEADNVYGALPGTPVATDQVGSGSVHAAGGCDSGSTSAEEGESAVREPESTEEFDDRFDGLD